MSSSWVRKSVVGVVGRKETRDGSKGGHALKLHWLCFDRLCLPRVPGWTANRGTGNSRVQRIAACALKHIFLDKTRRIQSSIKFCSLFLLTCSRSESTSWGLAPDSLGKLV